MEEKVEEVKEVAVSEEEDEDEMPILHTKEEKLEIITQKKEDPGYVRTKNKGYE